MCDVESYEGDSKIKYTYLEGGCYDQGTIVHIEHLPLHCEQLPLHSEQFT